MNELTLRKDKEILETQYPKVLPQNGVDNYFESKLICKTLEHMSPSAPGRHTMPILRARALKELHEAEEQLSNKRNLNNHKLKEFDEKWGKLKAQQELLRESQIKFNKFVKANTEKRTRAEKKLTETRITDAQRSFQVFELQQRFNYFNEIRLQYEKKIKEMKIYDEYLGGVVEMSDAFKNNTDVLRHYEALINSQNDISIAQSNLHQLTSNIRQEMDTMISERQMIMLGIQNSVAELESRFETVCAKSLRWETTLANIFHQAMLRIREVDDVRLSVQALSTQILQRRAANYKSRIPHAPPAAMTFEQQLVFIKRTLEIMHVIHHRARRYQAADLRSVANSRRTEAAAAKAADANKSGLKKSKSVGMANIDLS